MDPWTLGVCTVYGFLWCKVRTDWVQDWSCLWTLGVVRGRKGTVLTGLLTQGRGRARPPYTHGLSLAGRGLLNGLSPQGGGQACPPREPLVKPAGKGLSTLFGTRNISRADPSAGRLW